jgi:methyl-accepting chemotaxis protein
MAKVRRRAILAFLVVPIVFGILIGLILYLVSHWPYPPSFEWISRWTPRQLYSVALTLIALYVVASIFLAWRLVRRWLWESSVLVVEKLEGVAERGMLPTLDPPPDLPRLLHRVERALERHRSASAGVKEIEDVRGAIGRLCKEIEQMGLRHFDRDFSEGAGSLAPLGEYLTECCSELSGFMEGCKSVAAQISETMQTARELAGTLSSRAERTFVGHSEVSVGIKDFSKRIEEASRLIEGGTPGGGPAERKDPADPLAKIDSAVDTSLNTVAGMRDLDENRDEIFSDSKRLADEATVIALNAAIEASKSGSRELEALAENARKLAEGSMAASEKVGALSARYGDAVTAATEALNSLRSSVAEWRKHIRQKGIGGGGAADLDRILVSLRDFAASLADKSEEMARLSEATSSKARDAGVTTEEALREVEALMRRLGAGGSDVAESFTSGKRPNPKDTSSEGESPTPGDED